MSRWAVFNGVAARMRFFCEWFADFSVGAYDFQLSNVVSRVMFEVLRNVNRGLTITPNIYTNVKSQSQ